MQSLLHRLPPPVILLGVIVAISDVRASAGTYNPVLEHRAVNITGQAIAEMLIKGQIAEPPMRFRQDKLVTINTQAERSLAGEDIERTVEPALPRLCVLGQGQAICVLVAPETTYKAIWQLYQNGRPVEVLCVENSTKQPAYIVSRPQPEKPPEFELEEGLKFCSQLAS